MLILVYRHNKPKSLADNFHTLRSRDVDSKYPEAMKHLNRRKQARTLKRGPFQLVPLLARPFANFNPRIFRSLPAYSAAQAMVQPDVRKLLASLRKNAASPVSGANSSFNGYISFKSSSGVVIRCHTSPKCQNWSIDIYLMMEQVS